FRLPADLPPNLTPKNLSAGNGLDVKTDGGYVVVAGSRHRLGTYYQYARGCSPEDRPVQVAPPELLRAIANRQKAGPLASASRGRDVNGRADGRGTSPTDAQNTSADLDRHDFIRSKLKL